MPLAGCTANGPRTQSGAVAADHPLAEQAGMRMLELGGNAVDAAVATSLALSVVRPDSCGIGGGGFMVIHLEDDPRHGTRDIALNYRETCPSGVGPDTYEQTNDPLASRVGGMAVGVPGTVAGLLHALEHYGTLDRETVFAPAIELAERGWEADRHHVKTARSVWTKFEADPDYVDRFPLVANRMTRGGRIEIGDRIRNPEQARVLRRVADLGRAGFYEGLIAAGIVQAVERDGGVLTLDDLALFRVEETTPIRVPLGDLFDGPADLDYEKPGIGRRTMLVMPPPSSGGIAIAQMFGLLDRLADSDGFSMPATGYPDPEDARMLVEAMKHAFADRSRHLADPAFVDLPIGAMLDPSNLDEAARTISSVFRGERTLALDDYGIAPSTIDRVIPTDGGTSHISVIDAEGNAVACTETINLAFGSLLAPESLGFCLNNEMDDFTTVRGAPNAFGLAQSDDNLPEPGKRPLSSMSPTIVLGADGSALVVAGASGGPRIINATAQVLLRVLIADAGARDAVAAPRIHHQWRPDTVYLERGSWEDEGTGVGARESLTRQLEEWGYTTSARTDIGSSQLVRRDGDSRAIAEGGTEKSSAASDPRKRD